jgi:hypothetical protein
VATWSIAMSEDIAARQPLVDNYILKYKYICEIQVIAFSTFVH